jgi:hypothetical protein
VGGRKEFRRDFSPGGLRAFAVTFLCLFPLRISNPLPASAQLTLLSGAGAELEVGGYLRTLTGIYDLGYPVPDGDRTSGFNGEVIRLRWLLRLGENAVVEVHDRIQAQIASAGSGFGESVAGFGVSVVPGRTLDLTTELLDEEGVRAWHDVDRLALTVYTGIGDITLGRQAITWGISSLFPVADLWTQFSPFELDTEEKPGIDAVRLLTYPGEGWEVDAVVADRGSSEDLSAGVRASLSASWADVHFAAGKLWNEALTMAGLSAPVGAWKIRAEAVLPYDLDEEGWRLPRGTLGLDWLGGEVLLSGEYHFNGIGSSDPEGYGEIIQDPRFARGESYYLGRHYLGGVAAWTPGNDRLSLSVSALTNLIDPSLALTPVLTYDMGQSTRLSAGALVSFGDPPGLSGTPDLRSEYGTYGDLLFTRFSVYF